MNRRTLLTLKAACILGCATAFLPLEASAQSRSLKDELTGTWTPISVDNVTADGKKIAPWGDQPRGVLIFDANGRFSQTLLRTNLPKYASNNRLQGTPDEYRETVQGTITLYGTYSLAGDTLVYHVQGSSFPNFDGTDQKRTVKFDGDNLNISVTAASSGGSAMQVWRRVK
jgi:hypothetical protein